MAPPRTPFETTLVVIAIILSVIAITLAFAAPAFSENSAIEYRGF